MNIYVILLARKRVFYVFKIRPSMIERLSLMKHMFFATALSAVLGVVSFSATTAVAQSKSIWCMVDKSGDFTSQCYPTRSVCEREARKKGLSCGMTFE